MIDWRKELLDLRNDLQVRLGAEMRDIRHWTPFMLDVSSLRGSWSPSSGRGHPAPVSDAAVSDRGDQVVVEPGEGAELLLSLVRADGSRASLLFGTGEAVALAAELLDNLDSSD